MRVNVFESREGALVPTLQERYLDEAFHALGLDSAEHDKTYDEAMNALIATGEHHLPMDPPVLLKRAARG